jgi:hypothetical protein
VAYCGFKHKIIWLQIKILSHIFGIIFIASELF